MRFTYLFVLTILLSTPMRASASEVSKPDEASVKASDQNEKSDKFDIHQLRFAVTKKVLPNGLTVLLHVDHSVPTVSYHTWFRVGSKYEEPGFTGIAHLFEHMMFKGAKRYSAKELEQGMQSHGITNNAFTTYDYTGYYEDLPSSQLKLVIDMESDRIENLQLTAENLKSEREVVKEERRWRVDDSVSGLLNEKLWSTAYQVHPYKWPVIGWMSDIDALTLERCKAFFHTYYSVSNAVITVAGDIDPDETMALITEYYGKLPKVDVPKPQITPEPAQTAPREATVEKNAQAETMVMAYHIGKQGDPDSFVMDLISNILTEGDSSRLYKRLIYRDQKVLNVEGASTTPQDPGLFELFVQLKPKVKHQTVLPHIIDELSRMGREKVSKQELEKSKNQIMKHWVDSMKKVHDQAYSLVLNEIVTGNYENLFDDLDKYQRVTREDIQRVAHKYFTKNNRTIVTLIPKADTFKIDKSTEQKDKP